MNSRVTESLVARNTSAKQGLPTTAPSSRRGGKARAVFEALKEDILNGTIAANERLVERDLVERFEVSKTPVREALSMLRAEGLVKGRYYRGMTVVGVSPQSVRGLFDLREVLEGLAARYSASMHDEELMQSLEANLDAQTNAVGRDAFHGLNAQFHGLVVEYCDNEELINVLGRLYDQNRILTSSRLNPLLSRPKARNLLVVNEHRAIFEAIAAGDGDEAERRARQHVQNAYQRLLGLEARKPVGPSNTPLRNERSL